MAFLYENDYFPLIAQPHLEQILKQARQISGDIEIRQVAEVTAIARAKERLRQRYKVDKIFVDLQTFSFTASYKWGDRINFDAPAFDPTIVYTNPTLVSYNNQIFLKNSDTTSYSAGILPTNTTFWTLVGNQGIYYITPPATYDEDQTYAPSTPIVTYEYEYYIRTSQPFGVVDGTVHGQNISLYNQWAYLGFDVSGVPYNSSPSYPYGNDLVPTNTNYWTKILDYTPYLVTGIWPNDPSGKWTQGDNRSLTLVRVICDLALYIIHGIVNPNQVPHLRDLRYKEAEQWLIDAAKGDITPDLPYYTEDPEKGFSIRFGSNPPTTHSY